MHDTNEVVLPSCIFKTKKSHVGEENLILRFYRFSNLVLMNYETPPSHLHILSTQRRIVKKKGLEIIII